MSDYYEGYTYNVDFEGNIRIKFIKFDSMGTSDKLG